MDEVSAKARLADGVESPLAVAVPRAGVEEALQDEGADLILDLVRTNGQREERRIILSLDRQALEALATQEGEQVLVALDAQTLAGAFDEDVEAHGLREAGAALAILVTAAAGGAGMAGAAVDQQGAGQAGSASYVPFQSDFPTVQASVDSSGQYGMPRPTASDYAASEGQMPRAMPSDYAAADVSEVTLRRDPGAAPTGPAINQVADRGIENIRASQPPPAEAPDPAAGIEAVRVGGTAVPDPSTGIENVRAQRGPAEVGGGGTTISAPSTGAAVAIAGGAMLTIAAAAFALRRRREPGLA
jgi:hypothetical protein